MATATGGDQIEVRSPYDGHVVGTVPLHDAEDVDAAVRRAQVALREPFAQHERAAVLERASALLTERAEQFARIICAEAGKPIVAARVEAMRAADTLRFSAIEARSLRGEVVPMDGSQSGQGKVGFTVRRPIGVVAAITPFNFPLNLSCHKIGPAVAAGCTVVHKPASATPLSAVALRDLLLEAGLPEERYQLVFGSGRVTGAALAEHAGTAMITFTGSGSVGWKLPAQAPHKRVTLELGNSTPILAFADTDIGELAETVARHGFSYSGQSCISVQRVLVDRAVYDDAVEAIAARVRELTVGDPASEETVVGPLIDERAAGKAVAYIDASRDAGGRIACGGEGHGGVFVQPTVMFDVRRDMPMFYRELFGPGVAITPFDGEREAVELANATEFGLQAAVFTRDLQRAFDVAQRLEFGGVMINEAPTFRADQMPYGGVKDSGNTREGPRYAVQSMTEPTLVVVQGATTLPPSTDPAPGAG